MTLLITDEEQIQAIREAYNERGLFLNKEYVVKRKLSEITIPESMRVVDERRVSKLAASIIIRGLQCPIVIYTDNTLYWGADCLEAYRLIGFGEIECYVVERVMYFEGKELVITYRQFIPPADSHL